MAKINKFQVNAKEAELLSDCADLIQRKMDDVMQDWTVIGQKEDGSDKWGYVPKDEAYLDEHDIANIQACKNLFWLSWKS